MKHRSCEQWESRSYKRPRKRIRRDGRVGIHLVHIDDIIETLQEDHYHSSSDGNARDDFGPRRDVRVTGPSEPEEACREDGAAYDHGNKAFFGYEAFVFEDVLEARFGDCGYHEAAEDDSDEDGEER